MQFAQVVGQKELKQHLLSEVRRDKISHAQLFLGQSGYGILPLMLAFAQYILCTNKQENDSCGSCDSCRKMQQLQHPDVHFVFPTVQGISKTSDGLLNEWREQLHDSPYFSLNHWIHFTDTKGRAPQIGVEESIQVVKKLSLKSFEGGYKIMVIWMAEEMNTVAANKLLKILEEPPAKTLFFLGVEQQAKLLPTIVSRTQVVSVPRLTMDEIKSFLVNKKEVNPSTAASIAALSDGNLVDAIELCTDSSAKDWNREQFIQLMRVCYKKDVIPMMDWAEQIAGVGRERQKVFLRYALHMFRQSLLMNYTEKTLLKASDEEIQFLDRFARFITGNNIEGFMQNFNDAYYHIERNANAKILFTELCFKVMRFIHYA